MQYADRDIVLYSARGLGGDESERFIAGSRYTFTRDRTSIDLELRVIEGDRSECPSACGSRVVNAGNPEKQYRERSFPRTDAE